MKKITVYMLVLGLAVPVNAGWKFWKKNPTLPVIVVENPTYLKVITIFFILMVIVYIPSVCFFIKKCRTNTAWKTADIMLCIKNMTGKKVTTKFDEGDV